MNKLIDFEKFENTHMEVVANNVIALMAENDVNIYDIEEETDLSGEWLICLTEDKNAHIGLWELCQLAVYFNVALEELLNGIEEECNNEGL